MVASGMHANYCCCDVRVGSVAENTDGRGAIILSDTTREWEAIFVPSSSSHGDPN